MPNYSVLVGCPDPQLERGDFDRALRDLVPNEQPAANGWGPSLVGAYSLPLFWMAGFEPANQMRLSVSAVGASGQPSELWMTGVCSPTSDFLERLQARRNRLLSVFPASLVAEYSGALDDWASYSRVHFTSFVLLHPYEIPFAVGPDFDRLFSEALEAVSQFGLSRGVTLDPEGRLGLIPDLRPNNGMTSANAARAGLFGYSDADGACWPPDASRSEIEYFGQ